jgi:hypothetical protein
MVACTVIFALDMLVEELLCIFEAVGLPSTLRLPKTPERGMLWREGMVPLRSLLLAQDIRQ